MTEELSLYWTELCRSFDLPKDIRLYALLRFYTPLIQASKEFKLINECYLFCSGLRPMYESRFAFVLLLNNPKILLDTRIVDNRINIYVSLIKLFMHNQIVDTIERDVWEVLQETLEKQKVLRNKQNRKTIQIILEKGLECNNLDAFKIMYNLNGNENPALWSDNSKIFIKRIANQAKSNLAEFVTLETCIQEIFIIVCIEIQDYESLSIFVCLMESLQHSKYTILHKEFGSNIIALEKLQDHYKSKSLDNSQ